MTNFDKLFDEENEDNIILYDENNNEVEFEQVAIIPIGEEVYAMLKPVAPMEGVADDEALVFQLCEIDDEEMLSIVTDEKVVDAVFEIYYDLLREEGIEV